MNFSDTISARERQVLIKVCEQKTGKVMAHELGISTRWVEGIKTDLKRKTGADSMVGLALYAVKHKIFELI